MSDVVTKARSLEDVLLRRATVGIAGHTSQSTDIYSPSGDAAYIFTNSEISGVEIRYTDRFDDHPHSG